MTMRFARWTAVTLLVAGTTAGCFGGEQVTSPCDGVADDDPTAMVLTSGNPDAPDVIRGCIDSASDVDTITLDLPDGATGTWTFSVRCQAAPGVADFDTPAILDPGTPCVPTNPPYYATGNQTSSTVTVRAPESGAGGEYRLEFLVAQD
ncbi:MAG: hypothetical protein M3Z03_03145 [Actinomycetota bacterium]|nr:hypothetical protein [Actinomycetota bacterium]